MTKAPDILADAEQQMRGRWLAFARKLNGEVVWKSDRIHHSKRAALCEAIDHVKASAWSFGS